MSSSRRRRLRTVLAFAVPALLLAGLAAPLLLRAPRAGTPGPTHPPVAAEMAGVWLPDSRNSGRLPSEWPLNAEARKAADEYLQRYGPIDPTIDDRTTSCVPEVFPWSMRLIAQYPFEVLFTPGRVTVFHEVYGGIRRIELDPSRATPDPLPSVMGHSVGRWEGDTLVVETTRVRKEGHGTFSGYPPISSARRFVERITLDRDEEGRKQLRNEITIHDPVTLTQPVTVRMAYKWSPDIEVGEYLCQQDIWDQNLQGSPSSVPWRQ